LKHPNAFVRWSAAGSLIQLRTKKAVGPLAEALKDRSSMVYGTVIDAMRAGKFYRNAAAIAPLRRIVQRQRVRQQLPGLWRDAHALLTTLESMC
jgi:HEAT repeat protein